MSFGKSGSGQAEFLSPRGIAVDNKGNILVADRDNHRIQKFTAQCNFIAAVGAEGGGSLQFSGPTDVSFSSYNNKIYVVDRENYRV